jgi:hypothetical protein
MDGGSGPENRSPYFGASFCRYSRASPMPFSASAGAVEKPFQKVRQNGAQRTRTALAAHHFYRLKAHF